MSLTRKTKSLKSVIDLFNSTDNALSASELIAKFKDKMDKTTVYRILDRLIQSEILHSFTDNQGVKRYIKSKNDNLSETISNKHPHFLCLHCGISSCLTVEIKIPKIPEYKIKSSEHLLIGECKTCLS